VPTLFTRIIEGELPATVVWRDDRCVAFLSINPLGTGHTLVVPVEESDHWIDLAPELSTHLFTVAQVIGRAQHAAFTPTRIGLIVAGFEVPHVHIHVIPVDAMSQFNFANAGSATGEALAGPAEAIRTQLRALGRDEVSA
jgi:histidine triad (HIT) family protein